MAASDATVHGAPEFKPFVRKMRDASPDMHFVIEDMVAESDKVAARLRVTGTHNGGGLGFPATGRKIDITAITIIQFANGKLVHGWNNWDQLGMMQQLGMGPGGVNMDQLLEEQV